MQKFNISALFTLKYMLQSKKKHKSVSLIWQSSLFVKLFSFLCYYLFQRLHMKKQKINDGYHVTV